MFSQSPFPNLIREAARKFSIHFDRHNIRRIVIEEAEKKERYCTGDWKMLTSTLVLKDTKAKYDSNFLQMLIEMVLKDFSVGKDNIISIVTDNVSN